MLSAYARATTPSIRFASALMCAFCGFFFSVAAIWCAAHSVRAELLILQREEDNAKHPHMWTCVQAADEVQKAFEAMTGVPLERSIPAGVLSGGFAAVLILQAIRLVNRGRPAPPD